MKLPHIMALALVVGIGVPCVGAEPEGAAAGAHHNPSNILFLAAAPGRPRQTIGRRFPGVPTQRRAARRTPPPSGHRLRVCHTRYCKAGDRGPAGAGGPYRREFCRTARRAAHCRRERECNGIRRGNRSADRSRRRPTPDGRATQVRAMKASSLPAVVAALSFIAPSSSMAGGSSVPDTMRAAAIDRGGDAETLSVHQLPVPKPARRRSVDCGGHRRCRCVAG